MKHLKRNSAGEDFLCVFAPSREIFLFFRKGAEALRRPESFNFAAILVLLFLVSGFAACEREERGFRVKTPDADRINSKQLSTLQPGAPLPASPPVVNEYEGNAYALSEGKRLFEYMNCSGCHAHGGGGMGPPLMDDKWVYGGEPEKIFATIVEGRPNGMPSFRGKLPDYQIWQLAAYVRSLSGQVPKDAAPSRDDNMQYKKPENSKEKEKMNDASVPKSAEMPQ
ncbi:MAG TPA: c-type cytochrome [Pyrinomonadaceae bacterium]|jgi:cytochrome c oxidase cbb3-type subunit 3